MFGRVVKFCQTCHHFFFNQNNYENTHNFVGSAVQNLKFGVSKGGGGQCCVKKCESLPKFCHCAFFARVPSVAEVPVESVSDVATSSRHNRVK